MSSPGDLSNPGIELGSPVLQADCLPAELYIHIYSFFRLLYIIGYCKILNNVPSASIFIGNIGHNFLGNFYCQLLLAKIIGNNFLFSV